VETTDEIRLLAEMRAADLVKRFDIETVRLLIVVGEKMDAWGDSF
jgi:hypothetical protein